MRVVSPLETALFIAACLPAALAANGPMDCSLTGDLGGYTYPHSIIACSNLIQWVTSLGYGDTFDFPALDANSAWRMEEVEHFSHCMVAPKGAARGSSIPAVTEEKIPILDIWNAIETLRWSCTVGTVDIGNQWQVSIATENHVGKRYARSVLPSRAVSRQGSASHKAVVRGLGGSNDPTPPVYGTVQMTQIAIELISLAGIFYAALQFNNQHLPNTLLNAIPQYQTNNEDGAVQAMAIDLVSQMEQNREEANTLFGGPLAVTLHGSNGPWFLRVRMELPTPPPQDDSSTWHWANTIGILDAPDTAPVGDGQNEMADRLALLLRSAFTFLAQDNNPANRHTSGIFYWQLNGAFGAIPEDEVSSLPDIGPFVRIFVERFPGTPTPTVTNPPQPSTIGHDPGDLRIRGN